MKKCKQCGIEFNTSRHTCPFCKESLISNNEHSLETTYVSYPKFKPRAHKINLIQRIFLFISLISILVVFLANFEEFKKGNKSLWSVIVFASIFVLWCFIRGVILSKRNASKRILWFSFSLMTLIISIEYCSLINKGNYNHWSFEYVIPFILISTVLSLTSLIIFKPKSYSKHIGYIFWTAFLASTYPVFYYTGLLKTNWPSLACSLYGITTIIALFFFTGKKLKEELKKRLIL